MDIKEPQLQRLEVEKKRNSTGLLNKILKNLYLLKPERENGWWLNTGPPRKSCIVRGSGLSSEFKGDLIPVLTNLIFYLFTYGSRYIYF